MRAHKFIYSSLLACNMRPINVTLDSVTWELAKEKTNFSSWVRSQLRLERLKREAKPRQIDLECVYQCGRRRLDGMSTCESCGTRKSTINGTVWGEEE